MRRTAILATSLLAVLSAGAMSVPTASAQDGHSLDRHVNGPLQLNVRPRSWLDAGNVVAPYSSVNPASAQGQMVSYLASPPYINMRDRFGEGDVLPDPVTNGPFIGAKPFFGPIDFNDPFRD